MMTFSKWDNQSLTVCLPIDMAMECLKKAKTFLVLILCVCACVRVYVRVCVPPEAAYHSVALLSVWQALIKGTLQCQQIPFTVP